MSSQRRGTLRADAATAAKVAGDPRAAFVQQDVEVRATAVQTPVPSWGLDRIDQRRLPLNNEYRYRTAAATVTAFVIDTGTSAWNTSDTATAVLNGTSMASPHVAGVAALKLALDPTLTPAQVHAAVIASATPNVVINPGAGSPNRLLFSR